MSRVIRLLSVLQLSPAQLQRLQAVSPELEVLQRPLGPTQSFAEVLSPDVEILYTHRGDFDLQRVPQLRWVQMDSAGINQLQGTQLWESDITITSANGVHAIQIAEHVFAVLLSLGHQLPLAQRLQMSAHWADATQLEQFQQPNELAGTTLGIMGYGAIGRQVARLAQAFGMRVLATKRADSSPHFHGWTPGGTGDAEGSIPARFYSLDELHVMLAACDAMVLALPLTRATHHIIDAKALAAMRPHALLVNIARGALIDQQALITTLQEHRIGGAALDVTDPEPLPDDSPLWQLDNVLITPHIAGFSRFYNDRIVELFTENLRRYLKREPMLNSVQRSLLQYP
jgi:phosphoglycerate dehydrogenase-like enzyme